MRKVPLKMYWWAAPIIALVAIVSVSIVGQNHEAQVQKAKLAAKAEKIQTKGAPYFEGKYATCPQNISGILTAPLMEPKYISQLTPLGNINPPGHTAPVDHIYFATDFRGKIPLLAPADAVISNVVEILQENGSGKYIPEGFVLTYVVCNGLVLDFASYTDVIQPIRDLLSKQKPSCNYGIVKPGHLGGPQGQCAYQITYKVKSGDEIGWVQAVKRGSSYDLPFEIWAANYNQPARSDVNWSYYDDNRYAHSMCLFDLYAGDLKKAFYAKFGGMVVTGKDKSKTFAFVSRTIEPICGQVNQDIVGMIQGMWFAGINNGNSLEFQGKGVAFLHNNIDPTQGEISIGGEITGQAGVITFKPIHSGKVDREPSEVRSDGSNYCYNSNQSGPNLGGKILVQLTNSHQLKVEHLSGECGVNDSFSKPYTYQR
jgi:hypothetical protein